MAHSQRSRHGRHQSPVFRYGGEEYVVGSGKEGRIFLLDAESPGGEDHRTPLYRSELIANEDVAYAAHGFWGSFASWEDSQEVRWLFALERLYALRALRIRLRERKEFFSSGDTIAPFTHFGGIALSNGRIFVSTFEGYVYAFGLKGEEHKLTRSPWLKSELELGFQAPVICRLVETFAVLGARNLICEAEVR